MFKISLESIGEAMGKAAEKIANAGGYGIGYSTTTVVEETKYAADKVKSAVNGTSVAQAAVDGYYNGKNDAYEAFVIRAEKRELKAREKADNKAAKEATVRVSTNLADSINEFTDSSASKRAAKELAARWQKEFNDFCKRLDEEEEDGFVTVQ